LDENAGRVSSFSFAEKEAKRRFTAWVLWPTQKPRQSLASRHPPENKKRGIGTARHFAFFSYVLADGKKTKMFCRELFGFAQGNRIGGGAAKHEGFLTSPPNPRKRGGPKKRSP